jgi:3-oxoacyl-[acyl-carrier protein] reductase
MPSGSHIIFISTTINHASFVTPTYMLYCATKGAIEQMTRVSAKELAPKGIFVNAVAPGPTGTELFLRGKPESLIQAMEGFSPFNRLGKPEDIAEAIAYLAGSSWMAGQTIRVNGGVA